MTHLQNFRQGDTFVWGEEAVYQDGRLMWGEEGVYDFSPLELVYRNKTYWLSRGSSWHGRIPKIKMRYYPRS